MRSSGSVPAKTQSLQVEHLRTLGLSIAGVRNPNKTKPFSWVQARILGKDHGSWGFESLNQ